MTLLEMFGVVALVIGGLGFVTLAYDWWTERGKPPHNHREGEATLDCPRCMEDRS